MHQRTLFTVHFLQHANKPQRLHQLRYLVLDRAHNAMQMLVINSATLEPLGRLHWPSSLLRLTSVFSPSFNLLVSAQTGAQ
jgi:hypothetical protein